MTFLYSMEQIFASISFKDLDGISSLLQLTQKVYVGDSQVRRHGASFLFQVHQNFLDNEQVFYVHFYILLVGCNLKF